jgi:hypothetical protein
MEQRQTRGLSCPGRGVVEGPVEGWDPGSGALAAGAQ